jgi:hypothetical protein
MHMTATLTKWYEEHGKHEIFAGGKKVPLNSTEHALILREDIITNEVQHDLDKLGIAKTAREEKIRARDAKMKQDAENARMAKLYKEHILGEKPDPGFVGIESLTVTPAPAVKPAPKKEEREEVGSFGD